MRLHPLAILVVISYMNKSNNVILFFHDSWSSREIEKQLWPIYTTLFTKTGYGHHTQPSSAKEIYAFFLFILTNIRRINEKAREFQKNTYFCFIDYAKAFDCVDHNKLWKILKEMGIPDHLTCLLRNLYAGQEAAVRTGHGTTDWFQIGKGVRQGCILSPCLFNLYAEYIMRNPGLEDTRWNQDCREKYQ